MSGWSTTIRFAGRCLIGILTEGLTTIRFAGFRASLPVLYTLAPTGEQRGHRRASEVTHVIVKARDSASDRGGQGGDERAFGAQVRAFRSSPLAGEGGAHVAHASRSVSRGVAADRDAVAAGQRPGS